MSIAFIIRWVVLNLTRIRFGLLRQPVFTLRLFWKRIGWLFLRRFIGDTITSPVTGEKIFNNQSMTNYWAFHCIKELGTKWEQMVRNAPAPFVFDVGSNLGQFRSMVLSLNPGAHVITVDAWLEMADYVPKENHFTVAVSDFTGTSYLYKTEPGLTATCDKRFYQKTTKGEVPLTTVVVPATTLDDIWKQLGSWNVFLLKMDIDGTECVALMGAREMLKRTKILIVETQEIETVKMQCPGRSWSTVNNIDWVGILV